MLPINLVQCVDMTSSWAVFSEGWGKKGVDVLIYYKEYDYELPSLLWAEAVDAALAGFILVEITDDPFNPYAGSRILDGKNGLIGARVVYMFMYLCICIYACMCNIYLCMYLLTYG